MIRSFDCKLVLEDGSEYRGYRFGAKADRLCEVVFNTSMVGYQEIVSDPSYTDQAVVMTYPIIGNYGVTDEDYETKIPTIGGLVVREYNDIPSNFRYTKTVGEVLEENGTDGTVLILGYTAPACAALLAAHRLTAALVSSLMF